MRRIDHIVIHCSAEPHGRPTRAADIERWHRARGWRAIGYHYVIPVDGVVAHGRPVAQPGAHVAGHNAHSIAICLVGGLDPQTWRPSDDYAPAQWRALEDLVRTLHARHYPVEVLGHRDFPGVAKDCPCFSVAAWWREVNA
jgi:N-acetylmuramoyl-L-alanine amidase